MSAGGELVRRLLCAAMLGVFAVDALAAPPASQIQPPPASAGLFQVMLALGLVLAVIALCAWVLRRLTPGQFGAAGAVQVVGAVSVGVKERVVLVDVGDTRLILGVAPGQVQLLHQLPRPASAAESAQFSSPRGDFYRQLKHALAGKKAPDADR